MGCIGFFVYRWNAVFNPPKTRALVISILCFVAGIPFMMGGDIWVAIGGCAWCYACWYGGVWFYKYRRDQRVMKQAQVVTQPKVEQPVQLNNPDSYRLFVPGRQPEK